MAPKVAIVYYSTWGHILQLAEKEKEGLKKVGIEADIFQIPETLSEEILTKMHAPAKSSYPIADPVTLEKYDAFLFGIPTRYGNFPAQWKTFWDATGGQWQAGKFWGKYAGLFVSSGTAGGGQESTAIAALSTLAHHGIIYVPLGYATAFPQLANITEVRGGSPWGAGTFSAADGSRQPSTLELELATIHGESFGKAVNKVNFAWLDGSSSEADKVVAESNGDSPSATKNTQEPTQKKTDGKEEDESKDKEGPCGLPSKCAVLWDINDFTMKEIYQNLLFPE